MGWRLTRSVEELAGAAWPLLAAAPAEHTMSLTVIENARGRPLQSGPDELYGWWTDERGAVTGAATLTPPHELLLGVVPDAAMRPLADALISAGRHPPGVNGAAGPAAQFAAVWTSLTGERAVLRFAQRLYQLGAPVPMATRPAGRPRLAEASDRNLLVDWFEAFQEEVGVTAAEPATQVEDRLSFGGLLLWVDDDGTPVAVAGRSRPAAGVARIGPVFTPTERRRHGFGSAVTAALSDMTRRDTAPTVLLFTDLANPTSNAIYQRLGYQPVSDRTVLGFEPRPDCGFHSGTSCESRACSGTNSTDRAR